MLWYAECLSGHSAAKKPIAISSQPIAISFSWLYFLEYFFLKIVVNTEQVMNFI
ncbi:MAG: hypothetical protein M9931_05255 [Chitinophagales bacterium]|nr:hypothetical protein [Chitinophagales bacterium]